MSSPPFSFSLEFSGQGVPVPLLEELAGQVFKHAGCTTPPGESLKAALQKATAGGFGGAARCDVQFRAQNHTLEVIVSANGGRIWQGSCAIGPSGD